MKISSKRDPLHFDFRTRFEEKKIYEYLHNLINSVFLNHKSVELLYFASSVISKRKIVAFLRKIKPQISEDETHDSWISEEDLDKKISKKTAIKCLKTVVLPELEKKLQSLFDCHDKDLQERLSHIRSIFKLSDQDADILFFYYLLSTSSVLGDYLTGSDVTGSRRIIDLSSFLKFKNYGHYILGDSRHSFRKNLSKSALIKLDLIGLSEMQSFEINDWIREYLSGVGKKSLEHHFFTRDNETTLHLSDFEVSKDELLVLNDLVKGKEGFNILFYGASGTGKTSLAMTLAKEHGKELMTVKSSDDDEHKWRLQGIHATLNLADNDNSIILVDEADEILNTDRSLFDFSPAGATNKSWINNLIDNHSKKIIWITNRTSNINTATMRRFAFTLEFKKLSSKSREKILQHELGKASLHTYFNQEDIEDLCRNYSVDASGIIKAVAICKKYNKQKKETVLKKIRTILRNHEKVTGEKKTVQPNKKKFSQYTLKGLNTSHDLSEIIPVIRQHSQRNGSAGSLSFLFYGPPGTGKTEFSLYLGNLLDKDVLLKRCSEIHSMWVGETEKNIANAFQEARENSSILFFDEADSFLYPRSSAHHSWEITFTNEILAQLDSFTGLVIFATNDIDGLDHAAMRRFKFKIEFRYLTPEGNLHFYNKLLVPLVSEAMSLSAEFKEQIRSIRNLSPGDFAVVKDQFLCISASTISHQKLIDALLTEVRHKKGVKNISGFACNNP